MGPAVTAYFGNYLSKKGQRVPEHSKRMKKRVTLVSVILSLIVGLLLASSGSLEGTDPAGAIAGQTTTLLPDGRWLTVGGMGSEGALATVVVWDPDTQKQTPIPAALQHPRAWHTSTVLPDGRVMILGGLGKNGKIVSTVELFDPTTQAFETLAGTRLTPRAYHTATLLTDGRVLIAGGLGPNGEVLAPAELWDPRDGTIGIVNVTLTTPRHGHTANLHPNGSVLLWGGLDGHGMALTEGDQYGPVKNRFAPVKTFPTELDFPEDLHLRIVASLPRNRARDVPVDSLIGLRFSRSLDAETVNADTMVLFGPEGIVPARVTAAERGMLAFVIPEAGLLPQTNYTLLLDGAADDTGLSLPLAELRFTTEAVPPQALAAEQGTTGGEDLAGSMARQANRTSSADAAERWVSLPLLQAPTGVTALSGRVLTTQGWPLAQVTLEVDGRTTRTDRTGRFLFAPVPHGKQELLINGGTANSRGASYGVFEVGVEVAAAKTNFLPYTIWMPQIDTAHAVRMPSPTTREMVITTPRIPGLELRIAPGTVLRDHEGKVAREISITRVPIDRPPFPLPRNVEVPVYFTIQPGAAYIYGAKGARIIYPNYENKLPGTRFNFWHYEPDGEGWYIYGLGTAVENRKQVIPDPNVGIYEFTGAMVANPDLAPPEGPPPGNNGSDGDPVDLSTGLFVLSKTDLLLPDVLPIVLTRTYRPKDTVSRAFGLGTSHPYDIFIIGDTNPYTFAEIILPDGGRIHYDRISPGTGFTDAVYEHTSSPTAFYKSNISWNGNGWDLKLKDGTVYVFPDAEFATRPALAAIRAIRDRYGNALTLTRNSAANLTRITSPNGRWIEFTYDTANRITRATDNSGRTVNYTYDASGRLATVTDPEGGVTAYTYDTLHRMLTLRDARGIVFLTNEYDAAGRVITQTLPDNPDDPAPNDTTYGFAYTLDTAGKVTQTDVTDPRGTVRRVTFDASGYTSADTRAIGTPMQQTIIYERQADTNLVLSVTDPLARETAFTYDAMGNTTGITRLAGTAQAVTTSLSYEPAFNQVASITDPLLHTTSFAYDGAGNLVEVTNPIGRRSTLAYNAAGQPISVTDPLGNTTQFTYVAGDLHEVTDPLGNTTTRTTDSVGRVASLTNPIGRASTFVYDRLNRLQSVTDPAGGVTAFGYDPNGNLLEVTDALARITRYTYDDTDRLKTRTDPLTRQESYSYDLADNLTTFRDRKGQATALES